MCLYQLIFVLLLSVIKSGFSYILPPDRVYCKNVAIAGVKIPDNITECYPRSSGDCWNDWFFKYYPFLTDFNPDEHHFYRKSYYIFNNPKQEYCKEWFEEDQRKLRGDPEPEDKPPFTPDHEYQCRRRDLVLRMDFSKFPELTQHYPNVTNKARLCYRLFELRDEAERERQELLEREQEKAAKKARAQEELWEWLSPVIVFACLLLCTCFVGATCGKSSESEEGALQVEQQVQTDAAEPYRIRTCSRAADPISNQSDGSTPRVYQSVPASAPDDLPTYDEALAMDSTKV